MKKLLYIGSACVNRDISRTERLAQALLKGNEQEQNEVETLCLEDEDLKLFTGKRVQDGNSSRGPEFMKDAVNYAKQFAVRRPDRCGGPVLGFYFPGENEILSGQICVTGLTFFFQRESR